MANLTPPVYVENGLNMKDLLSTGSVLHINREYENEYNHVDTCDNNFKYIGQPVKSFEKLAETMINVDERGLVKKKLIEEGGGIPPNEENTVSIAFTGYWENDAEPFDFSKEQKPLVVDLKDTGLLPGLEVAIRNLLVGEMSIFLFSYKVMYGEMGIPPRIKPKANCVFYIKLLKSVVTPNFRVTENQTSQFDVIHQKVKLLYMSGISSHNNKNYISAIGYFRRCVYMLHECHLADENEERIQEKLLVKLYMNLAVCYNKVEQPLKTCTACNELNRLNSLYNNSKALFQNAKALRMIGNFKEAENKIKRSLKLDPDNKEIKEEFKLLSETHDTCNQILLIESQKKSADSINDKFKQEVDNLIKKFKTNNNLCMLMLPVMLNSDELNYIKDACQREELFLNKIENNYILNKNGISGDIHDCVDFEKLSL